MLFARSLFAEAPCGNRVVGRAARLSRTIKRRRWRSLSPWRASTNGCRSRISETHPSRRETAAPRNLGRGLDLFDVLDRHRSSREALSQRSLHEQSQDRHRALRQAYPRRARCEGPSPSDRAATHRSESDDPNRYRSWTRRPHWPSPRAPQAPAHKVERVAYSRPLLGSCAVSVRTGRRRRYRSANG